MPTDRFTVLSFNVRLARATDGADAWAHRRRAAASVVRLHAPAVVGCQEVLPAQRRALRDALPEYAWVGEGREAGEGEGTPIGYRTDRFDCLDHGTFWLSPSGDPGSVGWDASHPRVATWVRLRDERTGTVRCHLNTHLDHRGDRARREGAALLVDRLDDIAGDAPVVVTGDMNCEPGSAPYRTLTTRLDDARARAAFGHHGPTRTFHGFDGDPTRRIDYVFVDGADVRQHATLTDRWERRHPSDHFPVLAELAPE